MAISLDVILTALQDAVTAINKLTAQVKTTFPQATTVSTSVTAGAITYTSSQAAGFLIVNTSSGAAFKVPLYNT